MYSAKSPGTLSSSGVAILLSEAVSASPRAVAKDSIASLLNLDREVDAVLIGTTQPKNKGLFRILRCAPPHKDAGQLSLPGRQHAFSAVS